MSIDLSEVFDDALPPARTRDNFDLHRAALEWSLADPIIINGPEDIQSRPTWEGRVQPYQHQVRNLMTFCRRLPVTLLADDVGLGKTVSAGLILSELISRKRVGRALVVCPKILLPQWEEELRSKFDIEVRGATGQDLRDEFERRTQVVITTYNSAQKQIERAPEHNFNMLILDEAHKLRNLYGGSGIPPKTASTIRSVLERQAFRYVLMLTATPLHNRLWDLYSLIDCMTAGRGKNPFGTPSEFSARFIADASKGARKIKPGREEEFRKILSQYIARTRRGDAKLLFPERKVILNPIQPTSGELKLMGLLGKQLDQLNGLAQISLAQALFSSPQAFVSQVSNMTAKGTLRPEFERDVKIAASEITRTAKLDGLKAVVDQLKAQKPKDWRIVVFTVRRETQESIGAELSKLGVSFGYIRGADPRGNQETIDKFRDDPPGVHIVVSTDAGAEGLNLQVANVLVNFDLPWNPMIVEQRIGRIQRLGGRFKTVNVVNLLAKGTVEERVVGRLMEKLQVAASAIGDIEAILESVGGDDCEEALENRIAEMVVNSLKGMDVEEAVRLSRESIDRAREEIEDQRHEIDEKLGKNLDAIHDAGPRMPKLSRTTPRIPLNDFVLGSLKAEDYSIEPEQNKLIRVVPKRGPQQWITFDEAILDDITPGQFGGNIPKLYKQGSPAFERLAQSWCEKEAHFVNDLRTPTKDRLLEIASIWASTINGVAVRNVEIVFKTEAFWGSALCRVRSVVAMDSFEKLLEVSLGSEPRLDETLIPADLENSTVKLKLSELLPNAQTSIIRATSDDKDMSLFNGFYIERRNEELNNVGNDSRLRKKCHDDFTPKCFASIAGIVGVAFCTVKIKVTYSVNGDGKYNEVVESIPVTGQILGDTVFGKCETTGADVPISALNQCDVSKKRVLGHLLVFSNSSGRRALPEFCLQCAATGKTILSDESAKSDYSGKIVEASLLVKSMMSGRKGLDDEMRLCEISHTKVMFDELIRSEVSGKHFRIDQKLTGGVSAKLLGHREEFQVCAISGDVMLPGEWERSVYSDKAVRKDLLVQSELSNRKALVEEMGLCESSGKRLLLDELGVSEVSGRRFDLNLMTRSEKSGRLALTSELVVCEQSGRRLLPTEAEKCEATGKLVGIDLLERSAHSGRRVLKSLMIPSDKSGQLALPDEILTCPESNQRLLPSETGECAETNLVVDNGLLSSSEMSGMKVLKRLLVRCPRTRVKGLEREFGKCEESGIYLHPSAIEKCHVTGKSVDSILLGTSDITGARALRRLFLKCPKSGKSGLEKEFVECEVTRQKVHPELLYKCEATNKVALRELMGRSDVSGKFVLATHLARCPITGRTALHEEFRTCEVTHQRVDPSVIAECATSGTKACRNLMVRSAASGNYVLQTLAIRSILTGAICSPKEAVTCSWFQGPVLPSESGICKLTGLLFSKDALNAAGEFSVLRDLLNGKVAGSDIHGFINKLRPLNLPFLGGVSECQCRLSPQSGLIAVCATKTSWLGFKSEFIGFLVRNVNERFEPTGKIVRGVRAHGVWTETI